MDRRNRYEKIAVPLDGSGFSQRAIPHALDIARAADAELILVHVFVPPTRQFTDSLALGGGDEQVQQLREQAKQYLIGVRSELRNESLRVRTHYTEGADVAALVCDYVRAEHIDLIVMSTRGHSGLARLLFGSVARQVMECAEVPVLLVKPDMAEGV
jgi:nucleotide-binding universal stress UspA family protein